MKNIENMLLRAEKVELDIVFDSFGNSGTDGIFCGLVCAVHLEFVEYVFLCVMMVWMLELRKEAISFAVLPAAVARLSMSGLLS